MKRIEPSSSELVLSIQHFPFFSKKTPYFTPKTTQLSYYLWRVLTSLHQKISGSSFLCEMTTVGSAFEEVFNNSQFFQFHSISSELMWKNWVQMKELPFFQIYKRSIDHCSLTWTQKEKNCSKKILFKWIATSKSNPTKRWPLSEKEKQAKQQEKHKGTEGFCMQ